MILERADAAIAEYNRAGLHYNLVAEAIYRIRETLDPFSVELRTLDSIQLAVALSLHRAGAVENLVAADKVLCKVAVIEGMPVTDPEALALEPELPPPAPENPAAPAKKPEEEK